LNSGTLRPTSRGFFAQFSIGARQRKGVLLRMPEPEAERRKEAIAKLVARLRESGHTSVIANTIKEAGRADDEEFRKLVKLVDRIVAGKEPGLANAGGGVRRPGTTLEQLAKAWTSGELAKAYPDHVRVKRSSATDDAMLTWLGKVRLPDGTTFGARAVAAVTLDDCDHVMGALPKTAQSPSSRRQYAQALRKLLVYAVYPLRLISALPIPKGRLPKGKSDKAKAWIYPAEDLALMQCREVPLVRRLLYGLLIREGLRLTEALSLTWADVDLERGVLNLDTNKTDDPRSLAMGEDVALALDTWRALRGTKVAKSPRIFPPALIGKRWPLAKQLREGLLVAGVMRPELTEDKPGRRVLRAHDLRGSFVTLALAAGRTEAWVTDRTGHRSSAMIYTYKRAARTAAELALGWLAPLDQAIPELAPKPRQGANGVQTGGPSGRQVRGGRSKTPRKGHLATGRASSGAVGNQVYPQGYPGFESLSLRRLECELSEQRARRAVARAARRKKRGVPERPARGFAWTNQTPPEAVPLGRGPRARDRRHEDAGHVAVDGELLLLAHRPARDARGLRLRRAGEALLGGERRAGLGGLQAELAELRRRVAERRSKEARVGPEERVHARLLRAQCGDGVPGVEMRRGHGGVGVGQVLEDLDEGRRRVRGVPERELLVREVLLRAGDDGLHARQGDRQGASGMG
jgi:integrase